MCWNSLALLWMCLVGLRRVLGQITGQRWEWDEFSEPLRHDRSADLAILPSTLNRHLNEHVPGSKLPGVAGI